MPPEDAWRCCASIPGCGLRATTTAPGLQPAAEAAPPNGGRARARPQRSGSYSAVWLQACGPQLARRQRPVVGLSASGPPPTLSATALGSAQSCRISSSPGNSKRRRTGKNSAGSGCRCRIERDLGVKVDPSGSPAAAPGSGPLALAPVAAVVASPPALAPMLARVLTAVVPPRVALEAVSSGGERLLPATVLLLQEGSAGIKKC
mmetsp:Transcript_145928/g.406517  ORF Transcript_145928/g.406517 Transcript_145928/m.406517 type:complete len:205 (-) Transcript_145928:1075-1689(-)